MTSYSQFESGTQLVLAAGIRTPMTRAGGAFAGENVAHIAAATTRELILRSGLNPAEIDEVVTGCVGQPFDQANVSRVIGLRAGIPQSVPARTVARNCASGMEAVTTAAANILSGMGDTYICNGVELMSSYPLLFSDKMTNLFIELSKARTAGQKLKTIASFRPSFLKPRIALLGGLTDPTNGLIMGKTAENIARDFGLSREECDSYAIESHRRAQQARDNLRFNCETMPFVPLGTKKGGKSIRDDDGIRDDLPIEKLAKMKPYFDKPDGVVTIGNSCGLTDGAVSLLITTAKRASELGLQALAGIRSFAWEGMDPSRMGLGPVYSTRTALDAAKLDLSDMDFIELNEAFAAQVIGCVRSFEQQGMGEIDMNKLNPNGGAIALGHPVGATGARLLLTLAHQLIAGDGQFGLATLCIGGGQGGSVILERLK
ncbi:MAG: thiolase family protein [Planctomycetota bacterium]|jgi:acetyl-CoA acetyltransferase family protein|nr:thiolase family protein [Planctomycetota bacterium]